MNINQNSSLILRDLYSYDIVSAFPSIMKKINYDFKNIDLNNKEERNIFIGKEQKDNAILSEYLNQSVESLVDYYLFENDIKPEEIITTQKDGFILTKKLDTNNQFIEMKLRDFIDILIISVDRKKILYCVGDQVFVKGLPYFYDTLLPIYQKFTNLNFYDKSVLFTQLQNIKDSVMLSNDRNLFMIPSDDQFIVSTYKADLKIKDKGLIALSSINKKKYYDHYFKDFMQSIFLTCY